MTTLQNLTRKTIVASHVEQATNLLDRIKGLIGRSHLDPHHTLWISNCNSIHTFFMQFSIDVVFVNKHLIVKSIYSNIPPRRVILPVWGASSVFEFSSGVIKKTNIAKGDQLYVGH